MRKLLAISSYDSKVPMSIQCNIKSFIGHLQDITAFVIVRCRRMNELLDFEFLTLKKPKINKEPLRDV